ncbi:MAG: filamentous hemagglutinin N-terminal domain-containing protein, partial [Verrucomicrobia bacterium]|nr:filamentous hemagglutinin N-terminal domain-containing protein [Verrucomicrobiota bacterium]
MKRVSCIIPFLIVCSNLSAMPEGGEVAAGSVEFRCVDGNALEIVTSDKAIINYKKFNIGDKERVQFIQPSGKSVVLNRVKGGDQSKILGSLSANGRVFLVNPNGIYFGPNSTVNAGSFLASTLNIRDEDFLNDKFQFFLEPGSEGAKIINEGIISAGAEGFIAFLAPIIENRGSILARAGKVLLGSGERVTLDFTGDGLIQFTIDGDLKQALIENYGQIEAASGAVQLSMRTARDAIRLVVNTDGITPANAIEESNGVIRLVSKSHIAANQVQIDGGDGSQVHVEGTIDASNVAVGEKGGTVHVLGERVELVGAEINVSGDQGGGTVLIGGDYQGKGDVRTAQTTTMDNASQIHADAICNGDGGKVILWADDTTLFDGKIYARGGVEGGNGGFVETSGEIELGIQEGFVDTSAPQGKFGDWLLDPRSITIQVGGGSSIAACSSPNCATNTNLTIDPATIGSSATNVSLCAQRNANSSITVTDAVTMANTGISLTLTAGSTNVGAINLNNNITTRGGAISLVGVVSVGANVALDTTNAGGTPGGSSISFSNTVDGSGARTLSLNGGTSGVISMPSAVGATTPLASLTATGATITQSSTAKTTGALSYTGTAAINVNGNITTSGGTIGMTGPVTIANNPVLDTTNGGTTPAGAGISFSSTINGGTGLTLNAGTGGTAALTGAIGAGTALTSLTATGATITQSSTAKTTGALSYTGSSAINVNGNITTSGGTIGMTGPVTIANNPVFDTTNGGATPAGAGISFSSTINGATSLTLKSGTGGTAAMTGAVGAGTALSSLTATGATVTQGSTAKTTGALSYTGSTAINLGGNITTSGNSISLLTGPVTLNANVALDTTNAGGSPAGAGITVNGNVSQATTNNLTVNGGTGGAVSIGGNLNVNALTVTNSGSTTITGTTTAPTVTLTNTTGTITFNGSTTVSTAFNTAAQGYGLIFNNGGTVTPSTTLLNTGGVTLKSGSSASLTFANGLTSTASATTILGAVKATTAGSAMSYGNVTFSAGNSSVSTAGGTIGFGGTVTLTGNTAVDSTNGGGTPAGAGITFAGPVNGPGNLTVAAGTGGAVSFVGAVGGAPQVGVLTISSAGNVTANAITASSIVQSSGSGTTTFNGPVNTNGSAGISLTGTNFAVNANVTTTNTGPFTVNHSGSYTIAPGVVLSIDGLYTDNGTGGGSTNLAGTINTNGTNITFANPVFLTGTAALSTGSGVGNILFQSTLDGTQNLTLSAGTGNITFTGAVGTTRLGTLTINATNNVTANALSATVFNQTAGSGVSTFNGLVDISGGAGFSFVGANATFNSSLTTASGGPASFQVSNTLTLGSSAALNLDGAFSQTGIGSAHINGSITTTNDNIQFLGPVALTGPAVLNTGAGIGNILFSNTVDGPGALTMTAGTGNITLSSAAGSATRLGAVTINSAAAVSTQAISAASINQAVAATGTSTFSGNLNTNAAAGIQLSSGALTVNGNLITTNGGPVGLAHNGALSLTAGLSTLIDSTFTESGSGGVNLSGRILTNNATVSFANAVALTGTTLISSGSLAGSVNFSSTIDGGQDLTVSSGTGNTVFGGNVGIGTRLNNLMIALANNVTASSISAATFSQLGGTGTSTFNGPINTNAVGGVSLVGSGFTVNSTITTTAAGPVSITNSGTLNLASGAICSVGGAFAQINTGGVTLSGQVTAGGNISFQGPITLSGSPTLSTAAASKNITLANTVNGGGNLTLAAGGGNIALQNPIGASTRIGALNIVSALDVSTLGITAASITQQAGTGTTTIVGDLNTNALSGISLTLTNLTQTGGLATSNAGPVTVTNSGTFTSVLTGSGTIDRFYLQNGTGPVNLSGTVRTNNQPISFASPITLNSDVALNSGLGAGDITLSGTVNGAHQLNLAAGTGNVLLSGIIGGTTPLSSLQFTSAQNITAQNAVTANAIVQTAGSGTTAFNGPLSAT